MKLEYDLSELDETAVKVINHTKNKILLFYGEMGVGKTTLIKSIAKQLGVQDRVTSPTFSIVNEYVTTEEKTIAHFDFYRLKNEEEALDLGFDQYLERADWIFIEWPEKIASYIPKNSQNVEISSIKGQKRKIIIS